MRRQPHATRTGLSCQLALGGLLSIVVVEANADPYQPDASGQVVIEAEHFDVNTSAGSRDWMIDITSGFVGNSAMQSVPNSFLKVNSNLNANSPRMDYEVEYATATSVNVWVRGLGLSGSRDSVWVGVDGDESTALLIGTTRGDWGWETAAGQLDVPPGIHTINVWMREDGTIVDRVLISPLATVPSGDGPPESTRGGGGPPTNTAPVAFDDSFNVDENSSNNALPVLVDNGGGGADFDPDGDPITIVSADSPGSVGGTVTINVATDGLVYAPAADFDGVETFDYTIGDGLGGFATATVTVTVNDTNGSGGSGSYQPDPDGQIVIEAENFDVNTSQGGRDWAFDFTSGFVGASAMQSAPNSFLKVNSNLNANSPRIDYAVEYPAAVALNVWIRGLGLSGSRDSLWIGVDGDESTALIVAATRDNWGWETASGQIFVPAGAHTINVWMREDGTIVDRLLLTPLATAPSGDGPPESSRGGGGGPPANSPPLLQTVGDRTVIENQELAFAVTATDADGAPLPIMTADLSQLPGVPSYTDNNDGTGSFSWTPSSGNAPGPYSMTFTATDAVDPSLTDSETISIDVQAGSTGGGSGAYQPDASGQVVIEVEHFDDNAGAGGRDWAPDFTSGYIGDSAMQSVPNSFLKVNSDLNANSPRMDYAVEYVGSVSLNVWVRGLGLSGSRDSIWVGVNGDESTAQIVNLTRTNWGWANAAAQLAVPAGVHTINVWMREDGSIVDRVLLTPLSAVPSGDGPPESPRGGGSPLPLFEDFADGDANGWTIFDDATQFPSNWSVVNEAFVQAEHTNSSGKDVTETYHRGSYAHWNATAALTDYRLSLDVVPGAESGDDIGVMFRYADSSNYYRFSLNLLNGFARLEENLNGTFMTLASDHRGYVPGVAHNIVVEVEGPLVQVFVDGDPLFAASNSDHATGGIALFSRDLSTFDNVSLSENGTAPEIVIATPTAHDVLPGALLDLTVSAVARNVPATDGSVRVQYNTGGTPVLCGASTEGSPGVFSAQCAGLPAADYTIEALLLDNGVEVDRDSNTNVAVGSSVTGSHRYDAIGNSITRGVGDYYSRDNLNLSDQRTRSNAGWPVLLGDLLTTAIGTPNLVGNEGIPGDRASDTWDIRLFSIIERNPESDRALITLGTNDSNNFNTTPVADLTANIQNIINELQANGRNTIYLSLLPPAWGRNTNSVYPDPLDPSATRNQTIISYNTAIQGMLPQTGVLLGPDLFSCFLTPTVNLFSLFDDSLHPNALGYAFMAALWRDAIVSGPVSPPVDPCPAPIFVLDSLDPYAHGHKQNLLEEGDEYYTDASFVLTNIPPELADGIWVLQANADNANSDADFLSFDAGAAPVTVFVAYDPAGDPPTSTTHTFSSVTLSETLSTSDASVGAFDIVRATAVSGIVTIGGNKSGASAAPQEGYIVIVVP